MARKREQRLRRKARAALRQVERELAELQPVVAAADRYVSEIYAPNIKEPWSIANRRTDLVEAVLAARARQRAHITP